MPDFTVKTRKKLIEVALPLEVINKAAAYEKMPGIGPHPRGLHLWWARRPLAAARSVIFAQMVDDPSEYTDVLLSDGVIRRQVERELKKRLAEWEQQKPADRKADTMPTLESVAADIERQRLFRLIEELVQWENTTNEKVLQAARDEIWQSWRRACADNAGHPRAKELFDRHKLPAFHDPFAGGGSIPLEAQRLGLEAYASDLNPVAVLINKAMIEIPPKFAGCAPVNPEARKDKELFKRKWQGAQGLAEDVRYYGKWMRGEAEKRIGHLYPKVEITAEMAKERPDLKPLIGKKLTVIAWLWARTVKSPNPAFSTVDVPLASTFMLSTKSGKEAYIEPVIENGGYHFIVRACPVREPNESDNSWKERVAEFRVRLAATSPQSGTKLSRGANFRCVMSGTVINDPYIKAESMARRMGVRLMAIVAEGDRGRVYLSPTSEHEAIPRKANPIWIPDELMNRDTSNLVSGRGYGFFIWADLFTSRQLVALTTFSDFVSEAREKVEQDALSSGLANDDKPLREEGTGAKSYADAVAVYLGFTVDRCADFSNTCTRWVPGNQKVMNLFGKQAIAMTWDFPEAGILHETVGGFGPAVAYIANCIEKVPQHGKGYGLQYNATSGDLSTGKIVSTDPPYYDNIGYADLSDFFYVWLRRSVKTIFPSLFTTLAVPKAEELVATPYRHGSREKAETFFLDGMSEVMRRTAEQAHPAFPVTLYYAFKQSETGSDDSMRNTGWDTFLGAIMESGFGISGTWPMRSEQKFRMVSMGTNALASSIVLVCQPRSADSPKATRRDFVTTLKSELPKAIMHLQRGNIAPVDLAQAAIGPGMSVFTRYKEVVDAQGKPLKVRDALALINQTLDEVLAEQEGDFDDDTRWTLAWFEQNGFDEGEFGVAETLSKAKNTSIQGLVKAGFLESKRGKVHLLRPDKLRENWQPESDDRLTVWEMVHYIIRALESGGESAAAEVVSKLGGKAEIARELAYRLYAMCERKKRAQEALSYNALVQSWPEITRIAREGKKETPQTMSLEFTEAEE